MNIIWGLFGGWWAALANVFFGVLCYLTVVLIPLGAISFKVAGFMAAPFGKVIVKKQGKSNAGKTLSTIAPWCFLYKRPHVEQFMQFCRAHFRVVVWTTATPEHAHFCLSHICEQEYPFEFIWTRERCSQVRDRIGLYDIGPGYHWVKSLSKIKRHGYRLEQTMMVDDTPSVLERNYGNLIRIDAFKGDPDDRELLRLMPYLQHLKGEDNLRNVGRAA